MAWILIAVLVGVLLVAAVWYVYVKKGKRVRPMQTAPAVGAVVGALVGIALVEFAGWEYPSPFILLLLGMAAGHLVSYFYQRSKKSKK